MRVGDQRSGAAASLWWCDHGAVAVWIFAGRLYEVVSAHSGPDDAWVYELAGLTGPPRTGPGLEVVVPDATPDGPFTPMPARYVFVRAGGGVVPWPILTRFVDLVRASGDLIGEPDLLAEDAALPLTPNVWRHEERTFEVNRCHAGDDWSYELCDPGTPANDYLDVRVPDPQPDAGPFAPAPADRVTLTMHGAWTIPWPVFHRFLTAVEATDAIVRP